jgi:SAM-dependent methyltransferase
MSMTEDSGSLPLCKRRAAKRGGRAERDASKSRSASRSVSSGLLMSPEDWDRLWHRDPLSWVRPGTREKLGARQHYVDWVTQLLGGIDCTGFSSAELGCGTGLVTCGLYDQRGFSSGVLVDFSREAVRIAARNARGRNVRVVDNDVLTWQTEERFDLVFSIGLIEHFLGNALEAVVHKHATLLKPGGHAIIIVPQRSLLWPVLRLLNTAQGIREEPLRGRNLVVLCERVGLKVVRLKRFLLGISIGIVAQRL